MANPEKLYAERNLETLEPHYSKHVLAMTVEGLHAKADIAAELAHRDKLIEIQKKYIARLKGARHR